jgi:RNA polymerase sigma-70 factor (ECF subfamily)
MAKSPRSQAIALDFTLSSDQAGKKPRFRRGISVLAQKIDAGSATRSRAEDAEDDAGLLARASAGDGHAFRGLVDRHLPTVLAIARRMLRDDAEAEDVAQETLLRLWRNAGALELGENGVRPWLRRVVANLSIDRVRAKRNTTVTDAVPEEAQPAGQIRQIAERELGQRVDAALKALPERQRLALTLFHYEGMSQMEVGEAMGISDEAVESLLARARRTLKVALKDEWLGLLPEAE